MRIKLLRAAHTGIKSYMVHLAGSFSDLLLRYQAENVATIELHGSAGSYVDAHLSGDEYYMVIFKNRHDDIIHISGIDYMYIIVEKGEYCFVNRQTKYRPEQQTIH